MSREAKEGVIAISGDSKKTSIIEINCETDFVTMWLYNFCKN